MAKHKFIAILTVLATFGLGSAGVALADAEFDTVMFGGNQDPIKWEDLVEKCLTPGKHKDMQGDVPTNIKLSCKETRSGFVAMAPGEVGLPGTRHVEVSVETKNHKVEPQTFEVSGGKAGSAAGVCPRYKQVVETFDIIKNTSCSEILAFKGSLADFCSDSVNKGKGQGKGKVDVAETGRVIDTCGTGSVQGGKGAK